MGRIARIAQRWAFAAVVTVSLGFGAAQAAAAPAPAADARAACIPAQCNEDCRRMGYDGGICAGSWGCVCWIQ